MDDSESWKVNRRIFQAWWRMLSWQHKYDSRGSGHSVKFSKSFVTEVET